MSRPDHPVFHGPVPVTLDVRQEKTPEWYSRWTFDPLPETLPVVDVMKERYGPDVERPEADRGPISGLVTTGAGFLDSPDTEVIAGGIHSKGPEYFAIARQGRILQWGFAGTPDEMTDAGKALFLNSLHHVVQHGADPVVGFRVTESRDDVGVTLALLDGMEGEDRRKGALERTFGRSVPNGALADRAFRAAWFRHARPYLLFDPGTGTFSIDEDAKALGIPNHDPALLARAAEDWAAGREPERGKRLLERYTGRTFESAEEATGWLGDRGAKLTFSDVSGYRFRDFTAKDVAPAPGKPPSSRDAVDIVLDARSPNDGKLKAFLSVRVAPGYHVYMPSSKEPAVVTMKLRVPEGKGFRLAKEPPLPAPRGGHASGSFQTGLDFEGEGSEIVLLADYQACTEKACLPPVTGEEIRVALAED